MFNLSDEDLEFQVNDRRFFVEFVGLGVMNNIPDATTIAFFREIAKGRVIEELFEMFETYLRRWGCELGAVRLSTQRLFPFPSNATRARRTQRSRQADCLKVGMRTQTACSRRT